MGCLLGVAVMKVQADIVPCTTVAQAAGPAYETRSDWFATRGPIPIEAHKNWALQAQFKGWQIWQVAFSPLKTCQMTPIAEFANQRKIMAYPVVWQSLKQKPAVVMNRLLIEVTSDEAWSSLIKNYPLTLRQIMPKPRTAILTVSLGTDLDKIIQDLSYSVEVTQVTPLLSLQRYRLR